jgi:hypothetical protein
MYPRTAIFLGIVGFTITPLAAKPPAFEEVLTRMIQLRNQTESYTVEYTLETHSVATAGGQTYVGTLYVMPEGFRHDRVLVDGINAFPGTQATLEQKLGRKHRTIVTRTHVADMGANGPYGTVRAELKGSTRLSRLPFDPRGLGLGFVGDVRKGWSLERTASNLLDWNEAESSRWVSEGVAEYKFGDTTFVIDIDKGYWPIGHRLAHPNDDGTVTVESQARVTLSKQEDGTYLPTHAELSTDNSLEVYDLKWQTEKPSAELLDYESVAESSGIIRLRNL